jgi:hypothetical protein
MHVVESVCVRETILVIPEAKVVSVEACMAELPMAYQKLRQLHYVTCEVLRVSHASILH